MEIAYTILEGLILPRMYLDIMDQVCPNCIPGSSLFKLYSWIKLLVIKEARNGHCFCPLGPFVINVFLDNSGSTCQGSFFSFSLSLSLSFSISFSLLLLYNLPNLLWKWIEPVISELMGQDYVFVVTKNGWTGANCIRPIAIPVILPVFQAVEEPLINVSSIAFQCKGGTCCRQLSNFNPCYPTCS